MKAIKIMFSTKKYLNKKYGGCSLKGYAYYVFDDNGIINKQFIQIIEGEYRQTDFEMAVLVHDDAKVGTDFYRIKWKKDFRTKYLDGINHNPSDFTKKSPRKTLSKEQIELINVFFISNDSPVLTQSSLIMGSNSTGAEKNPLLTPLMSLDNEYLKYNFANPLNKFYKKSKININNLYDLKIITLKEYFEKYNKIDVVIKKVHLTLDTFEVFQDINSHRILVDGANKEYKDNFENKNLKLPLKNKKQKEVKKNISVKNIQEDLRQMIQSFKYVDLSEKQIKSKLTSIYNYGVRTLIKEKKLSYCLIDNHPNPENAHIISKKSLFKNQNDESLFKSADPFNCLRLSPNIHTSFDNNTITFTTEGKIIDLDGKILLNEPIKDILNSSERMKYISENYEYWKVNKCNK